MKYAINLFVIVEFDAEEDLVLLEARNKVLNNNAVDEDLWGVYLLILVLIYFVFRLLAVLALQYQAARQGVYA